MENNLHSWLTESYPQRQMFQSSHGKNTIPNAYAEQCPLGDHAFLKNEPSFSFFHFSPSVDRSNRSLTYDHELLSGQFAQFPHPLSAINAIAPAAAEGVNSMTTALAKGMVKEMEISSTAQNLFPCENSSPCPKAMGRKRSSNRERHSKIITKQGLRDRRMRLSVDVARKFFGLQDRLGFDKASKTVGWLLRKSKAAIKEVTRNLSQSRGCKSDSSRDAYSTSESEDLSGIDETTADVEPQEKDLKQESLEATRKGKRIRELQKAAYGPVGRESRAIARAKARERTMEKMSKRLEDPKQFPKVTTQDQTQLRSLSLLGSAKDSSSHITHDKKSLDVGVAVNEPHRSGISMFDHHQQGISTSNLMAFNSSDMMSFFPDNWDMDSTRTHLSCCDIANMHLFSGNIIQ